MPTTGLLSGVSKKHSKSWNLTRGTNKRITHIRRLFTKSILLIYFDFCMFLFFDMNDDVFICLFDMTAKRRAQECFLLINTNN